MKKFLLFLLFLESTTHAQQYTRSGEHSRTVDSLNTLLKSATHDTTRASILVALTEVLATSNPDTVIPLCKKSLEIISKKIAKANEKEKHSFLISKTSALNNIAYIYDNQGQMKEALDYYTESLIILKEIKDKMGIANILNNIGTVYINLGQVKEALECLDNSLRLREEIGDNEGVANSLNNIGYIYDSQGQMNEALDYYRRSLKILEGIISTDGKTKDKEGISYLLNNIGVIYQNQGKMINALEYLIKSLKFRKEIGDKKGIAYSLNNIGYIYKVQGQLKEAMAYHTNSLKLWENIGDKKGISHSLNFIGNVYLEMARNKKEKLVGIKGNWYLDSARSYSLQSLALSTALGYPENLRNAELTLAKIDSARGNPAGAFEHYKLYIVYRDSIKNKENEKAAIRQQTKYEFEKAMLVKEQEERERSRQAAVAVGRRNKLQYSVILIVVVALLSSLLLLGKIKVSHKIAEGIVFFVFLIFFEFILVLADPYIESVTGGAPGFKLLFNAIVAAAIYPVHAYFERWVKKRMIKKERQVSS